MYQNGYVYQKDQNEVILISNQCNEEFYLRTKDFMQISQQVKVGQ